jgi:hypothetical protein
MKVPTERHMTTQMKAYLDTQFKANNALILYKSFAIRLTKPAKLCYKCNFAITADNIKG